MTTLSAAGVLLASDTDNRKLRYRLVRYGEPGDTSAGRVAVDPGTITVPEDLAGLIVNEEHNPRAPIGHITEITDGPEELDAEVTVARTRAGDDALELAATGLRRGISVELADVVIRSGRLISGRLIGAGLTVKPAFSSSTLTASDTPTTTEQEEQSMDTTTTEQTAPEPALTASAFTDLVKSLTAAKEPELTASAPTTTVSELAAAVSAVHGSPGDRTLMASALETIAQPNVFDVVSQPAYVGELWRGRAYRQRFAPLLNRRLLTSATRIGWKFKEGFTPQVDVWDPAFTPVPAEGNPPAGAPNLGAYEMTDIPSNPVAAEPVTFGVGRIAGGWRTDRVHKDLPTPGFWEAFWREATEDYAKKEDGLAMAAILSQATEHTAAGADAASAWSKLILGASIVLDTATPEWAVVGNDVWRELAATTEQERLAFLNAQLGLDNTDGSLDTFTIVGAPYSRTDLNGTVTVGARHAIDLYTLGGGAEPPIRVTADVVQKGAVDDAVFGYYSLDTINPAALVKVV